MASVGVLVIKRFERGSDPRASTGNAIERALVEAGVSLIDNARWAQAAAPECACQSARRRHEGIGMISPRFLEAHHEAGHALARIAWRHTVRYIMLDPPLTRCRIPLGPDPSFADAVCALAGPVTGTIFATTATDRSANRGAGQGAARPRAARCCAAGRRGISAPSPPGAWIFSE